MRNQTEVLVATPECQSHPTIGDENPSSFGESIFASLPDAVEARHHIEAVIGEGEGKYVTNPKFSAGRSRFR